MVGHGYLSKWVVATHDDMTAALPNDTKSETEQYGGTLLP